MLGWKLYTNLKSVAEWCLEHSWGVPWCSLQKNRSNRIGIAVLLHGIGVIICGVHFRPIELSFACDTWLVIVNAFAALFLSMVQNFAIDTEFTISRCIGFWLIGVLAVVAVEICCWSFAVVRFVAFVEVGKLGRLVGPVWRIPDLPLRHEFEKTSCPFQVCGQWRKPCKCPRQ